MVKGKQNRPGFTWSIIVNQITLIGTSTFNDMKII